MAIYKGEIPAIYAGYLVRVHPILIESDYLNYVMQSQYYWIYCQNVRSDAIGQSNIMQKNLNILYSHFLHYKSKKELLIAFLVYFQELNSCKTKGIHFKIIQSICLSHYQFIIVSTISRCSVDVLRR